MAFSLVATILYTMRAFYSKKVLSQGMSKYGLVLSMRFYGLIVLLILLVYDRSSLDFTFIKEEGNEELLLLASIFIGISGLTLMYEVLSKITIGNFAVFKSIAPISTVFVSFILLGERLALLAYIGIGLICISIFYLNFKENNGSSSRQLKIIGLLFISFLLMSAGNVIYASISSVVTPLTYSISLYIISILLFGSYIIFISSEKLFEILRPRRDVILLGIIATLAMYVLNVSFTLLSPTIVNTVLQLQIFLMIVIGYIIFRDKANLRLKTSMALVSFLGICLILYSTPI
jgi:drug/metabolite transporter (DMT)-like permease